MPTRARHVGRELVTNGREGGGFLVSCFFMEIVEFLFEFCCFFRRRRVDPRTAQAAAAPSEHRAGGAVDATSRAKGAPRVVCCPRAIAASGGGMGVSVAAGRRVGARTTPARAGRARALGGARRALRGGGRGAMRRPRRGRRGGGRSRRARPCSPHVWRCGSLRSKSLATARRSCFWIARSTAGFVLDLGRVGRSGARPTARPPTKAAAGRGVVVTRARPRRPRRRRAAR